MAPVGTQLHPKGYVDKKASFRAKTLEIKLKRPHQLMMEVERFRLPKWLLYLSYLMIAWMPLMLISTRIHYTIDVLSSPFYVLFTKDICRAMGACPDYSWSLPHLAYTKLEQALCNNSK